MINSISDIARLAQRTLSGSHLIHRVFVLILVAVVIWVVASVCVGAYGERGRRAAHK